MNEDMPYLPNLKFSVPLENMPSQWHTQFFIKNLFPSIPDPSDHQPPLKGRYRVVVRKFLQNREQPCTELLLHILAKILINLDLVTPLAIWGSVRGAYVHVQHQGKEHKNCTLGNSGRPGTFGGPAIAQCCRYRGP